MTALMHIYSTNGAVPVILLCTDHMSLALTWSNHPQLRQNCRRRAVIGEKIPRILGYTVYISTNKRSQQSYVIDLNLITNASRTMAEGEARERRICNSSRAAIVRDA